MKKLLTILLVFTLCLPLGVMAKSFPDTEGLPCEAAVSFLNDIGIVEGKSEAGFEPAASLTRAEMATIIVRLYGMEAVAKGTDAFEDVPASHWAYNAIGTAYELGIINGIDKTHFAPDEALTYEQAVKMLVCALGYTMQAEALGGYPTGYLTKASQIGLLEKTEKTMNRGVMAQLVANAVETPLSIRESYGDDYAFTDAANRTLLTEYLGITTYKGRITANYITTLNGDKAKENEISLDGTSFAVGESGAAALVGQKVTLYVREDVIISAVPDRRTEVLVINADEIEGFSNNILSYGDKKISLAGARFVYNGEPAMAFTRPANGTVTLICDDGTEPDVVLVSAYTNLVVKRAADGVIYFKEGDSIDTKAGNVAISFVNADGTEAKADDCKEWNILSVVSATGKKSIIRSDKKVAGVVTETSDDTVIIGDVEYKLSQSLIDSLRLTKAEVGTAGVFYLDFADRIAAVDTSAEAQKEANAAGDAKYGYLVATEIKKGMDGIPQFKFYTQDGKMQVFEMGERMDLVIGIAQKASVTAEDFTKEGTVISVLDTALTPQLVRYTEKDGKLAKLELAANVAEIPQLSDREARLNVFSLDRTIPSASYYGGRWNTFSTKDYVSSKTVIFNIPTVHSTDEKDYAIMTRSQLGLGFVAQYSNVEIYDEDLSGTLGAIIVHKPVSDYVADIDPVGLITAITKGLDADGNEETRLKIANSNGLQSVYTIANDLEIAFGVIDTKATRDNTVTVDGTIITDKSREPEKVAGQLKEVILPDALRPGDVVAFVETNGVIDKMAVRFRATTPIMKEICMYSGEPHYNPAEAWLYTDTVFWFGEVTEVGDDALNYKTLAHQQDGVYDKVNGPFWTRMEPFDSVKIMEFNMKTGAFKSTTKDAINVGDYVLGYRKTVNPQFIIVYKEIDV